MREARKLLVISAAFPPMRAGEAAHTLHLCQHLADHKLDVHVLTSRSNAGRYDSRIVVHPVMRSWSWSELPRFVAFLRRCAPDAVLLVYISWIYGDHPFVTFAATITKSVLPDVPFVTQFENPIGIAPRRPSILTRLVRRGIAQWAGMARVDYTYGTLLRDSDRLIALSERHRAFLVQLDPAVSGKTVVIPPPPNVRVCSEDNGASRQRGREALGTGKDDFLIAYFGYIYPNKGVETLLKAFQIVRRERHHARLVLIGGTVALEGPDRPSYAQRMRELSKQLGIEDGVTWTGEYGWNSDEASLYLRAADVCVLPFDTGVQVNNSSLSVAVAHELPIITTRGAVLEEVFVDQENALLCPPKSPEAMADAIRTLMDNPNVRERLRVGAQKLSEEWFSWEKAVARTIEALSIPS